MNQLDVERMHTMIERVGDRLAELPEGSEELDRLRSLESRTEFKAYLEGLLPREGLDGRDEFVVAAAGPDWREHRERLIDAAARAPATEPKE